MGIEALTHRDDGSKVTVPASDDDWLQWVSAGRTRNWMLHDPLIDWLQLYGESRGYEPKNKLNGYVKELDFLRFISERSRAFEAGILRLLREQHEVITIAQDWREIRRLDKAEKTFEAMRQGAPIIYQAVLWDAQNMTYGSPDFLMRSDVLHKLFSGNIAASDAATSAPDLAAGNWHYRVVDTKFITLQFNSTGTGFPPSGVPTYKVQLYIYNRMLGRLQGYLPPASYLLGRGWEYKKTIKGEKVQYRGNSAMERLGPIPQDGKISRNRHIADAVEEALQWIRRLRSEGHNWELLPKPSVPELYPNMGNPDDADMMRSEDVVELGDEEGEQEGNWESFKKWLANELKELTLLSGVGVPGRKQAHSNCIYRWDDSLLSPDAVGVGGRVQGPKLADLLAVNTNDNGPPVLPEHIESDRDEWLPTPGLEFYVDFEFCSNLNDDFSQLPEKGGQPLIFMIGCGHMENGEWQFRSLIVNRLTEDEELRIIQEWVAHISTVRNGLDPQNDKPRIFHWSHAEVTQLENAYNSARERHKGRADWPRLNWYDFHRQVIDKEPVVVRGALGFGLKAVANAMHSHGLIETNWADSPVDGLGAMVGAWRCDEEAREKGVPMTKLPLMDEIACYNEVDCKVMMEIVRYLRANH